MNEEKFLIPEYGSEDLVLQVALFNSNDYEGCEDEIDWKELKEENPNLPENSEFIFKMKFVKKKLVPWSNEEISTLKRISSLNGFEKNQQIKLNFPNRSLKSCLMKIKRIREKGKENEDLNLS